MDRRTFLGTACSAAAWPLITPVVVAAAPGDRRLVVIVLRGALDGMGMVQPYGDRDFAGLRPTLAARPGAGLTDLDGFYGLADQFAGLMPLWRAGELGFATAVSTPYRGKRSHFDGQDLLETGSGGPTGQLSAGRGGWLNRALALIPGARAETALAVGQQRMLILDGEADVSAWSPRTKLALGDNGRGLLNKLYSNDRLFAEALTGAEMFADGEGRKAKRETGKTLARFAAGRLKDQARIAAFSLGGWDTHRGQAKRINGPARMLTDALITLRDQLGPVWRNTAVIAVTEFGRTARENGSRGTDHGTGGVAILSGGAMRGGQVQGRWPGLGEGDLYEDRDLMATDDVRRWAAWLLAGQFGVGRSNLEGTVFPGLEMGRDPGMLG